MKFFSKRLAVLLLSILCTLSLAGVLTGCNGCAGCNKSNQPVDAENAATERRPVPTDGSTPMEHTAAENVAYLAYVLDNQPFYHAYARNSTKAMAGYEQITQTWKDYMSAEASGEGVDIMISSDLSHSMFVKSSAQACFIDNNRALTRSGSKPGKNTLATEVNWNTESQPNSYNKKDYVGTYGLFSTEISVYVINASTIDNAEAVVNNGDGTYTQKMSLKADAGVWYQYAMKNNGGLKTFPVFNKIEIEFTFDANWKILSSYCEEKIEIAPAALGKSMNSNCKTTTTYDYTEEGFDNVHFGYFADYFKKYMDITPGGSNNSSQTLGVLDVLGNAFSEVLGEDAKGQQFGLTATLGETDYNGKIYLKIGSLQGGIWDIVNSIDARVALEKKNSGKQDLFVDFSGGTVNAYYSDGFAVNANVSEVKDAVENIIGWINSLNNAPENPENPTENPSGGSDFDTEALMKMLYDGFSIDDTSATLKIVTDDLLGTGIGVDLIMSFTRTIDDGFSTFALKNAALNSITYKGTKIALSLTITSDGGTEIISHNKNEASFNIADFANGVYELLNSPVYKAVISLDGSADIEYVNGLVLDATAYVKPENSFKKISANVDLNVSYSGITALVNVYYVIDTQNGGYGDVYITLKQLNGNDLNAKVCCNISDTIETVKELIGSFGGTEAQALSDETADNKIASVINNVISLDFGKIIKELKANQDKLNLTLDVDTILGALDVDLGVNFGDVALELGKDAAGKATLNGELSGLGLELGLSGASDFSAPDLTKYVDINTYISAITGLINSTSYKVDIALNGANTEIEYIKDAQLNATAYLALANGYKDISAEVTATVNYEGLDVELSAYYTINIDSGKLGEVYLDVTKIGEIDVDAKVHCDITETVDAVKAITGKFTKPAAAAYAVSGAQDKVAGIIGSILEIDFASIIKEIKANNTTVNATVNADGLLSALGVSLGGIKLGDVALELTKGENGSVALDGKLSDFGLEINLSGTDREVAAPTDEYADLATYINYVTELLNSEVYAINVELNGAGSGVQYLENVTANINAYAKLGKNYDGVEVYADSIALSYLDEDLIKVSVNLSAYYAIGFNGENLGKAYLNITNITFGEGETARSVKNLDVKVTAEISSAIDSVKAVVDTVKTKFGTDEKLQAPAATYANVAQYINYVSVVKQIKASKTALDVSLDVDGLLGILGLSEKLGGMEFGSIALGLSRDENGKALLGASLENLGLTLGVSASDTKVSEPDSKDYANVNEYLNGVNDLLNNKNIKTYLVNLTLNGKQITIPASEEGANDTVIDLTGLTLNAPAQVKLAKDFNGAEVFLPLTASYETDELSLNVQLTAFYTVIFNEIGAGSYGDIYLNLRNVTLNNETTAFDAKVKCNIAELAESIKTLISLINGNNNGNGGENGEATVQAETAVSDIIAKVISLDYVEIINSVTANGTGINLNVSVDEILKNFVDLKGFELGNLDLTLTAGKTGVKLNGTLEKLGLGITISGSGNDISEPKSGYLNLNELMDTVLTAYGQATAIIESEDALFILDGTLTIDGVSLGVNGSGEVIWHTDNLTVKDEDGTVTEYTERKLQAVSVKATLSVEEDGKTSKLNINFIYDDRVNENEAPLVKLTIGTLGLDIYRKDIKGTSDGVQGLINAINSLKAMFGKNGSTNNGETTPPEETTNPEVPETTPEETEVQPMNEEGGLDYFAIANVVLGQLNKFGITLTGEENVLKSILVSHANGSLKLSANGALAMDLNVSNVLSLKASVTAPEKDEDGVYATGAYTSKLNAALGEEKDGEPVYTFYGSGEDGKFVKAVYEYVFDVIESLSIKEILDTDAYVVHLALHGDNSGIPALAGVTVLADLYYTEGLNGTTFGTKLVEAELDITIKNTVIRLNARYAGQSVFIELKQIAGSQLIGADSINGIKIKAELHDVYEVAETLYNLVTGINFPEEEAPETPVTPEGGGEGQPETQAEGENAENPANGSENEIVALLTKLLSLNLDGVISHEKVDGENVYTIKPDCILEAFEVNVTVGTVTISVNPETHKISASATVEGKEAEWLSFNAKVWKDINNEHNAIIAEDYIDLGFVKMLVKDLGNTLVDEQGNINTLYSFSGNITASLQYKYQSLPVTTNINFNNTVLTAGLDEKGEFYLTLKASLDSNPVNVTILWSDIALGKITTKGDISFTYSNGYISLGRDGQYKVMTMAYFLDNITADDSPVKWWLGTEKSLWDILKGQLPAMSSGLTTPDTVQLYETKQASSVFGANFYLSSILNGYQVDGGNGVIASYGTEDKAADELGLKNAHNYYSFDINGNSLTNGTIRTLYAALLRNGTDDADPANSVNGISGILAKLNVMGMITVNVTLDKRATNPAENFFNVATENLSAEEKETIFNYSVKASEHQTNIFGCYDTAGDGTTYYSPVLDKVTLILLDENGNAMTDGNGNKAEYSVTYGSTVYLDSVWAPFWSTEEGFEKYTITYGDKDGNTLGGTEVVQDGVVIGTYIVLNDDSKLDSYLDEDGNKVYTITVRRITDKKAEKKAVTYHTGVEGVEEITAAFALNADGETVKLLDYDIGGYVLLGMYTDENYNYPVSDKNAFAGSEVYCLYVIDTVTEDGVIYKLHKNNEGCVNCESKAHYHVNSYDANTILPYTVDGSYLFIKNVIAVNGVNYPVTAIDENAFAYMGNATDAQENPGIGAGLKNVIVPENIKYVGTKAFGDNYGIQSVVFLASEVTMGGGSENDKNGPFYGCSTGSEGTTTSLKVYYHTINGGSWTQFRQTTSGLFGTTKNNYHIGSNGGELIGNGNWAYVTFVYNGVNLSNTVNLEDLKFDELVNGINRTAHSNGNIEEIVTAKLNSLTVGNGYINAFVVTVTGEVALNGKLCTVTVTIEEKDADKWYYPVNVTNTGSVSEILSGEVAKYGDTVYAEYNSLVTISSAMDGYEVEVESANVEYTSADGKVTFTMSEKQVNITLVCTKQAVSEVTIISKVEFTFGGYEVAQNSDGYYYTTVSGIEEDVTKLNELAEVTATGDYTFLGWSYKEGETLTFTNDIVTNPTYYAVWAINRDGVGFTATDAVSASGELPSAEKVKASNSNGLGGWYTDDTFATKINELTVENSVLYARLQYNLEVNLSAGTTTWGYNYNAGDDNGLDVNYQNSSGWKFTKGQEVGTDTCKYDITVLEGCNVEVSRKWANTVLVKISDGTNEDGVTPNYVETYLFKGFKTRNSSIRNVADKYSGNDKHYIAFTLGDWQIDNGLTPVAVDSSTTGYYNTSGTDQAFGSATVNGNLSFKVNS